MSKEKSYNVCHQGNIFVLTKEAIYRGDETWKEQEVPYTVLQRDEDGEVVNVAFTKTSRQKIVTPIGEKFAPDSVSLPEGIRKDHAHFEEMGWL
jgi:hypothetical protein